MSQQIVVCDKEMKEEGKVKERERQGGDREEGIREKEGEKKEKKTREGIQKCEKERKEE